METISRKDAHERGFKKFYTGKPCHAGHDCQRYVASGACIGCIKGYSTKARNPLAGVRPTGPDGQALALGLERFEYAHWPEDAPVVAAFVAALNAARKVDYDARTMAAVARTHATMGNHVPPAPPIRSLPEGA